MVFHFEMTSTNMIHRIDAIIIQVIYFLAIIDLPRGNKFGYFP